MADSRERIIAIITGILKLDAAEVENLRKDAGYQRLSKWTSSHHAEIIVALEDEFGIEIEERAIAKLNNVDGINKYVIDSGPAAG